MNNINYINYYYMSEIITIKNNNKNKIKDLSGLTTKLHLDNQKNNKEILLDILEILDKLNDRLKDIEMNHRQIYLWVKKQEEIETEPLKSGWFY